MAMAIFDQAHLKIIESTFSFTEFVPTCKKSSLFHQFIFEIQSILESHDQTFDQLLIFVNLYQHAHNHLFQLFILQINHAHPKIF